MESQPESPPLAMETDVQSPVHPSDATPDQGQRSGTDEPQPSTSTGVTANSGQPPLPDYSAAKTGDLFFFTYEVPIEEIFK